MSDFERLAFKTNDGANLNLLTSGSGRPLVMIPGWSQTAAMYKEQLLGLENDCRVIAMDPRGHGDSEDVTWGYTVQRLAMDLREVLTAFELENVALMGHSMGNSVMWAYLQMFGEERLERLIIVDEPTVLTGVSGTARVLDAEGRSTRLAAGDTVLIPASCPRPEVRSESSASILQINLPLVSPRTLA